MKGGGMKSLASIGGCKTLSFLVVFFREVEVGISISFWGILSEGRGGGANNVYFHRGTFCFHIELFKPDSPIHNYLPLPKVHLQQ